MLYVWGNGNFGQHGHVIDDVFCAELGKIETLFITTNSFCSVSCGASYTFAYDTNDIFSWGNNQNGQLGCLDNIMHLNPIKVNFSDGIKHICCGDRHTVLVTSSGKVYGCGSNFYAQLTQLQIHHLDKSDKVSFVPIPIQFKVKDVACGQYHSLFLLDSGEVASVGRNMYGQLGVSMPEDVNTDIVETPTIIERKFGNLVVKIFCGQNHSLAIDGDGTAYCWGFGRACGVRQEHVHFPRVIKNFPVENVGEKVVIEEMSGGASHTLFLTSNGEVFSLGCNSEGQCGVGEQVLFVTSCTKVPKLPKVVMIASAENYSAAVSQDEADLLMWGRNSSVISAKKDSSYRFYEPTIVYLPHPVKQISCGTWHAAAIVNSFIFKEKHFAEDEENNDLISKLCDVSFIGNGDSDDVINKTYDKKEQWVDSSRDTSQTIEEFYRLTPSTPSDISRKGSIEHDDDRVRKPLIVEEVTSDYTLNNNHQCSETKESEVSVLGLNLNTAHQLQQQTKSPDNVYSEEESIYQVSPLLRSQSAGTTRLRRSLSQTNCPSTVHYVTPTNTNDKFSASTTKDFLNDCLDQEIVDLYLLNLHGNSSVSNKPVRRPISYQKHNPYTTPWRQKSDLQTKATNHTQTPRSLLPAKAVTFVMDDSHQSSSGQSGIGTPVRKVTIPSRHSSPTMTVRSLNAPVTHVSRDMTSDLDHNSSISTFPAFYSVSLGNRKKNHRWS